ncbi:MAG: NAD(P)/FAD-dependent oxidoreductase [Clostridia bacterium]|nr:NAD(P)/FAD-dependent oxidoreductase [Clostridia bacterium]
MPQRYDIAIIGTGPAGISAAITAAVRGKTILLLGPAALSEKLSRAERIENYPGLPAISGADFARALSAHLGSLGIRITDARVGTVYAMGDWFGIQAGETMYEASSVILACGVAQGKPLPGEEAFLGRGVSYCATCDARLYRGKTVAVLAYCAEAAKEAEFLATVCARVLYFPVVRAPLPQAENLEVIRELPRAIAGEKKADAVLTDAGAREADGIFVLRDAVLPERLVPGLATEGERVAVDLSMRTNLPGLFACGDAAGRPYQYVKAAGQGNTAALSAVEYLSKR